MESFSPDRKILNSPKLSSALNTVNEPLYTADRCDMETLIDGQNNMTLYDIYGKNNGFDPNKNGT